MMDENTTNNNLGGQMAAGDNNRIDGNNEITLDAGASPWAKLLPNQPVAKGGTTNNNLGGQMSVGSGNSISGSNKVTFNSPVPSEAPVETVNVLFVLSNPRGTDGLRLNAEMRAIEEALRLGLHRDRIQVQTLHAATANDLRRALLAKPYQIVHLSGHGNAAGFALEDEQGRPHVVSPQSLGAHFLNYQKTLRCILLNACATLTIGQNIAPGIPHVIAMNGPIDDRAAIEFSRGFYDAIGAGLDIERAYAEGLSAVRFAGLDQYFLALRLP